MTEMQLGEVPQQEAQPQDQGVKVRVMAVGAPPKNVFAKPGMTFADVLGEAQINVHGNMEFRTVNGAVRAVQPTDLVGNEEGTLTVKTAIQGGDVLEILMPDGSRVRIVVVQVLDHGFVASYVPVDDEA
jgi:hypothetical protein